MMPEINNLRPSQEEILRYKAGKMGISAVPGSRKVLTYLYNTTPDAFPVHK